MKVHVFLLDLFKRFTSFELREKTAVSASQCGKIEIRVINSNPAGGANYMVREDL